MKRIYIAGPMTGYPELNFPLFHTVAADMRARGFNVVNPAELNSDPEKTWHECMRVDIRELATCDAILMLPGWEQSKGATLERHIAKSLEFQVEYYGSAWCLNAA